MAHGLNEHGHTEGRPPRLGHGARALGSGSVTDDAIRAKVHDNATLKAAFERINGLDRALYDAGVARSPAFIFSSRGPFDARAVAQVIFCAEFRRARTENKARSCLPALARAEPAACDGVTDADLRALAVTYPPF